MCRGSSLSFAAQSILRSHGWIGTCTCTYPDPIPSDPEGFHCLETRYEVRLGLAEPQATSVAHMSETVGRPKQTLLGRSSLYTQDGQRTKTCH